MREIVYSLCALTSLVCAILLTRAYRASRTRFLLWSTVCFSGLFLNNVLLFVDELLITEQISLLVYRDLTTLASIVALLVGLVWDTK
jgi:hypothetical protein